MTATPATHRSPSGHGFVPFSWRDRNIRDTQRGRVVRIREFEAPRDSNHPGILLWLHGGSWISGSVDSWTPSLARLAAVLPCRLVAVRYRLAPHPAAIEDVAVVVAGLRAEHPDAPILLGGDSAGATIAASAAIELGRSVVDGQLLLYPPTDPSCARLADDRFPTRRHMRAAWSAYAGSHQRSTDIALSPLLASVSQSTPPAAIVVGAADPLACEVVALAQHLEDADVPVRTRVLPGIGHGALLHPLEHVSETVLDTVIEETWRLLSPQEEA